ncbi:MAG: FHA domain-containing protein [Chloroflexi bacterium]|nr:FHA domain-containing protein [Chloroflexota bacterium]
MITPGCPTALATLLRRIALVCLSAALAWVTASPPAAAQTSASAAITTIDISAFPEVRAFIAVSELEGNRVPGLTQTAFQLTENNSPLTITGLSEEETGLQIAFVIESSNIFSKRDREALTRLDYVKTAVINFAVGETRPFMKDALDDVSLYAPEGPILEHSTVGGEIRNALISYQSEFLFETGLFGLIRQGLNAVTAEPPRLGMRREIVIFSSGIDASADAEIATLAAQAVAQNIVIHTVLVGPQENQVAPAAENLKGLAVLTGGSYRYFDDPNSMTTLWDALVTQRAQYRLVYRSQVAQSGQQTLIATVNIGGTVVTSPPAAYSITVQPPVISITNLPAEILRSTSQAGADPATIDPRLQTLAVQVNFPDGFPRSVSKLQLLVDGAVVDERTAPPLDSVTWDLSGYGETAAHGVQVVAVDELGLEGRTDIANVLVRVDIPPPISRLAGPALIVAGVLGVLGVALVAIIFAAIIYLRRPPTVVTTVVRDTSQKVVKEFTEPFMPTPVRGLAHMKSKAYLEVGVSHGEQPHPPIELIGDNLRLGRDGTLAQIVFPDRSVSRLHARIAEETDGVFMIYDEGATSGTWVNYNQVPMTGQQLQHGDLINLGRVQLRFMLRQVVAAETSPAPLSEPAPDSTPEPPVIEDHSTEPFEPPAFAAQSPELKPVHEPTDHGSRASETTPLGDDVYRTEAFDPSFNPTPPETDADDKDKPAGSDPGEKK